MVSPVLNEVVKSILNEPIIEQNLCNVLIDKADRTTISTSDDIYYQEIFFNELMHTVRGIAMADSIPHLKAYAYGITDAGVLNSDGEYLAKESISTIYLATDPDREGEAIAQETVKLLDLNPSQYQRLLFYEITPRSIKEALNNPLSIDENLVAAQTSRQVLDRMIGFCLSSILQKKLQALSAGRVHQANEQKITLRQVNSSGELIIYKVKSEAEEAKSQLGFSVAQTTQIAQKLYEGVWISSKKKQIGLITYPRTDSTRINREFVNQVYRHVQSKWGKDYCNFHPAWDKKEKKKANVQDAHEAIHPTYLEYHPEEVKSSLVLGEYQLYKLIFNHTLASLMSPAQVNKKTYNFLNNDCYHFTTTERICQFAGFLACSPETYLPNYNIKMKSDLEDISQLEAKRIEIQEYLENKPVRYNEGSVVQELEKLGIGRPSTYNTFGRILLKRGYVTLNEKGQFIPTERSRIRELKELDKKDENIPLKNESDNGSLPVIGLAVLIIEYPKQQKNNVTRIHSDYQSLEGSVKIEKFANLKELSIHHNEITKIELKLQGCLNLKKLCCSNNYLVGLDLSQNSELEELNIENNNFSTEQNLSFLSHLVNLRELKLGNSLASIYGELANEQVRKKVQQGSCNHFTGSLESLQGLTKLRYLDISNTELDDGLEYLPNSITSFSCSTNLRKGAKVRTIYNLFADEQGIVETTQSDGSGSIKDFLQKLPEAKQKPRDQINQIVAQRKIQRKLATGEEVIKTEIRDFMNRFKNQEAKRALEQDSLEGYKQFLSDLGSARLFNALIKEMSGDDPESRAHKSKKTEISNILYRGKGNSVQLRKEVDELQEKLSDYKKIVQQSQESRKIINQDNNQVCEGAYQIIEETREKHKEIKEIYKSIEGNIEKISAEVAKHVSVVRRLTQKLLGNQQSQNNVEVLHKGIYKQGSRRVPAPLFHDETAEKEVYQLAAQLKFKSHYYASLRNFKNSIIMNFTAEDFARAEKRIAKKRLNRASEGVNDLFASAIANIQKL
nr:1763_t:CDS:10 [Entrophospora candida]